MVLILGLHFGHDASAALVDDGTVVACLQKERHNRVKHAAVLRAGNVASLLDDAGVTPGDVDYCTVTSTQGVELVFFDSEELSVLPGPVVVPPSRVPFSYSRHLAAGDAETARLLTEEERRCLPSAPKLGSAEGFGSVLVQGEPTLAELALRDYRRGVGDIEAWRHFHAPCTVRLLGTDIPGAMVSHHFAHAAYAYYESPFERAAVLSHDGGFPAGVESGLFCYAEGSRLYPLAPHALSLGMLYDEVAVRLGLGRMGGAGKLMGLAPYGQPVFYARQFRGNWNDMGRPLGAGGISAGWWEHCVSSARRMGQVLSHCPDAGCLTASPNADVAASTQRLFEESSLEAARTLHCILSRGGVPAANLCLGGGAALNCVANTRLLNEGPFEEVSVLPGSVDSGLAIGSALALWHHAFDAPREPRVLASAFLGLRSSAAIDAAVMGRIGRSAGSLTCSDVEDAAVAAATDLARDRVVGWFEGRSELGPRALGHRSLLAHPSPAGNWPRVNAIKGREAWRPLAPMVLESEAPVWFRGCPAVTPYMLFTSRVAGAGIPAVTHVDGSARLQTVSPSQPSLHRLLRTFRAATGCPVLLNTSLNGRGEPIVERPEEAAALMTKTGLEVLYLCKPDGSAVRLASASCCQVSAGE